MGSSILGIGQSALTAAQVGVATTGHNIANATTPGYSRQVVIQGAAAAGDSGFGFVGKGTEITSVTRVYNEFLANQVLSAQTSQSRLSTYSTQIKQVDNLLADSSAGLSPALQDFFKGVQDLSSDPNSSASRQALLSSGESLAARFQSLGAQLGEIKQGVNGQINSSVTNINAYATQIAKLNDAIEKAQAGGIKSANDLLDQRDQAVYDLSKEINVSVVKQGDSYNVFIGTGQPLVVGTKTTTLFATTSPTDPSRAEIGSRTTSGVTTLLDEKALPGGKIGGFFDFRKTTLDVAQNTLGRVATSLATQFNAQHALGQTQTGALGGAFFNVGAPEVSTSSNNSVAGTGKATATITDATALQVSDYRLQYTQIGSPAAPGYQITRLSDGTTQTFTPPVAPAAKTVNFDGVDFGVSGTPVQGDEFLIRPVANGAAGFSVAITDKSSIAVGTPIATSASSSNAGTGSIGAATVKSTAVIPSGVSLAYATGKLSGFPVGLPVSVTSSGTTTTYPAAVAPAVTSVPYAAGDTLSFGGVDSIISTTLLAASPVTINAPNSTLTYAAASNTLSGFPTPLAVSVTTNGTTTVYPPGTPLIVPYAPGATIAFGGISFIMAGTPANGDSFKVSANPNGLGDNRNALLLGKLQTAATLDKGTTNFQGAYSQLVSTVGNKAHELQATSSAATSLLEQSIASQQSESGVNLDEEAANLLRYQQAYQAAGKLIQTASTLFGVLLSLGG